MNERKIPQFSTPEDSHDFTTNGVSYDVYKLIEYGKNIKPVRIEIIDLDEGLDSVCWDDAKQRMIAPRILLDKFRECGSWDNVIAKYPELTRHVQKIKSANYVDYPILIHNYSIIDGMHRLVKATTENAVDIYVRILDQLPADAIIKRK